ncbi:MAG: hypothetical protein ACRCY4_07075 [Brevinema sp.]
MRNRLLELQKNIEKLAPFYRLGRLLKAFLPHKRENLWGTSFWLDWRGFFGVKSVKEFEKTLVVGRLERRGGASFERLEKLRAIFHNGFGSKHFLEESTSGLGLKKFGEHSQVLRERASHERLEKLREIFHNGASVERLEKWKEISHGGLEKLAKTEKILEGRFRRERTLRDSSTSITLQKGVEFVRGISRLERISSTSNIPFGLGSANYSVLPKLELGFSTTSMIGGISSSIRNIREGSSTVDNSKTIHIGSITIEGSRISDMESFRMELDSLIGD